MRRVLLTLALVPLAAPAWAQSASLPGLTAADVVSRVMTFDRDGDGRLTHAELAERMHHLIAGGDLDGNRALDLDELRALASDPLVLPHPFVASSTYGIGLAETGISTRAHIEGAVADLKLPEAVHLYAMATAMAFVDALENDARAALLDDLARVLVPERLADFTAAVDAHLARTHTPVERPAQQAVDKARLAALVRALQSRRRVESLQSRLAEHGLSPEQRMAAFQAIDRFEQKLVLDDAAQAAVVARMTGILNEEERENFRAAIARKPVAPTLVKVFVKAVVF